MNVTAPIPAVDPDTAPYWEAAWRGVLLIQRCDPCGRYQFYPRARCRRCFGTVRWIESAGRGRVYAFTVVHRAPHPAFAGRVPYVVALVDLDEGVRLMTTLPDVGPDGVTIGQPVAVAFEQLTEAVTLPVFRIVRR